MINKILARRIEHIGGGVLRWSLVLFFVGFGLYKFTPQEAAGVSPVMAHSPALFWVNPLFGVRGGSDLIGAIEILMGASIAARHVNPLWSAYGSLATSGALLITKSFLFTTPGLDPRRATPGSWPRTSPFSRRLVELGGSLSQQPESAEPVRRSQTMRPRSDTDGSVRRPISRAPGERS